MNCRLDMYSLQPLGVYNIYISKVLASTCSKKLVKFHNTDDVLSRSVIRILQLYIPFEICFNEIR